MYHLRRKPGIRAQASVDGKRAPSDRPSHAFSPSPLPSEAGMVREPAAGAFDEVVAPGGPIQAAIDRCREGGAILLKPGTYEPSETLVIAREVHVFGRGLARLRILHSFDACLCLAPTATLDGLILERARGLGKSDGVLIHGGHMRLQNTAITGSFTCGISVLHEADPFIVACRSVQRGFLQSPICFPPN